MAEDSRTGNQRGRSYSEISEHSSRDAETLNSPRRSRKGGRNKKRLNIQGTAAAPSVKMVINTGGVDSSGRTEHPNKGNKAKRSKRSKRKQTKERTPVDEGGVERKLEIRDRARDINFRVEESLTKFDQVLKKDNYRLAGRLGTTGTTYDVLNQIKQETEVFTKNLDRIGWDRDEVMEDLGNWMAGRSGEAAHMEIELRNQLLDGGEQVKELMKESISDMVNRTDLLTNTSEHLSTIFDRTVETAAREIKEGVKKGAKIAVQYEKEKMMASKLAMAKALRDKDEEEEKKETSEGDAVARANAALKAVPDPAVVSFINKFKVCRDRMRKAEGAIQKFKLASFASEDKFNVATKDWEEKRRSMKNEIKEMKDQLRLSEKKLERTHMKAREKEVRDRKQGETTSFIEKQSNRKGTEMLKMQLSTLKMRVSELEREIESTENVQEELRMEVADLEEKLDATKDMVTRAEYDSIKRQLFEASDLVDQARADAVAAQKDLADAKEETAKAYEEKALVMDELSHAKVTIKEKNEEIAKLKTAVEEAELEKQRALAAQKLEYEKILVEERARTEEQRKRAEEAEAAAMKLQDRIEELEQEIIDLKEAHEAAIEALREEHEEEKRKMEEAFAEERRLLEEKIARAEHDLNLVTSATNDMLTTSLETIKIETTQLTKVAVSLHGRAEMLRKVAEEGLQPPEEEMAGSLDLTRDISALVVGSAIDLSHATKESVEELAETAATSRLSSAYTHILEVISNTKAFGEGLLSSLSFVQGTVDSSLMARFADQQEIASRAYHSTHVGIARSAEEVVSEQLPETEGDQVDLDSLLESRARASEFRLAERRAREGALKRQAATLVAVKEFLVEETRRAEEGRNSLARLDVEIGKVQYYLETGGLLEGDPTLTEVLDSLRARRLESTTVCDMSLLGPNVTITHPRTTMDSVNANSEAFHAIAQTMRSITIEILENGEEKEGSESEKLQGLRKSMESNVSNLIKAQQALAASAGISNPAMEEISTMTGDIYLEEMMLLKSSDDVMTMKEAKKERKISPDPDDRRFEMFGMLVEECTEESTERMRVRDEMLAEKEGALLEKMEMLESALDTAAQVYEQLRQQARELRRETTRSECIKGRLADYIGSQGQLGDAVKLIEEVRRNRSSWTNLVVGLGMEMSNIPAATVESMSTLLGSIDDWINTGGGNPEPGAKLTMEDATLTLDSIQKLHDQQVSLLSHHIVHDPSIAIDASTLLPMVEAHLQLNADVLSSRVLSVVVHSSARKEEEESEETREERRESQQKIATLEQQLATSKKDVSREWESAQQAYYDTFQNEQVAKLEREKLKLLEKLSAAEKDVKRLTRTLQATILEKEQAIAVAEEAMSAMHAAEEAAEEAVAAAAADGANRAPSTRGSSRKSRASSRGTGGSQFGGNGFGGALTTATAEKKVKEYSVMSKLVTMFSGMTERLREIAPPMEKQNVAFIPSPVSELSASVLQKLSMIRGEGEEREETLFDALDAIDDSSSKFMLAALEKCMSSLAKQISSGVWIGKPHKSKIEKPRTLKASLRVSRSNVVRTSGSEKHAGKQKRRKKTSQEKISKSELANSKLYVTELEMELQAMTHQVRGHGKLEEMERSAEASKKLRRMFVAKKFHYLQSKLKSETAKREILEQTMSEEVPEKEIRAAKFHSMQEHANLERERTNLTRIERASKNAEVRMLNAFEDVHALSNKVALSASRNSDAFSPHGMQETFVRRDVLRLNMLSMSAPDKLMLSPIKKQGRFINGVVGDQKSRGLRRVKKRR